MYKNKLFDPSDQGSWFYGIMGEHFANRKVIKELDNQLYNDVDMEWILNIDEMNEKIRGCISVQDKATHNYIDNFYVLEMFRGKGIGQQILDEAMKLCFTKTTKLITRNEISEKMFSEYSFKTYASRGRYSYMIREVE